MKRIIICLLCTFLTTGSFSVSAQCSTVSGVMSSWCDVAGGEGHGCESGCNELAAYNVNCILFTGAACNLCNGTSYTGNCTGGELLVSSTINIPAGCVVTVTAQYMNRSAVTGTTCGNGSGMDGGDLIGINNAAGTGVNVGTCADISGGCSAGSGSNGVIAGGCFGSSNGCEQVTWGPQTGGVITVWGNANRSDEIITYTITTAGTCLCGVLPIELIGFVAFRNNDNSINLNWATASEVNNNYFQAEYSQDGPSFTSFAKIKGAGTSNETNHYSCTFNPINNSASPYFRLKQIDFNGEYKYSPIITVGTTYYGSQKNTKNELRAFYSYDRDKIVTNFHLDFPTTVSVSLQDISGREISSSGNLSFNEGDNQLLTPVPAIGGIYLVIYKEAGGTEKHRKLVIPK